jgi:hypothetical protein
MATPLTTTDELRLALAQPEIFGFQLGVWHAINAPVLMVQIIPEVTLAGRLRLTPDELASALRSRGLGQARQASWLKHLRQVRPVGKPQLDVQLVNADMHWRGERFRCSFVRFAVGSSALPEVEPKDQIALGSTSRQPLPLYKTHEVVDRLRSADAAKAAAAAAAAETERRAQAKAAADEAANEAALNRKRSLRAASPERGSSSSTSPFAFTGSRLSEKSTLARVRSPTHEAKRARPKPSPQPSPKPSPKPSSQPSSQSQQQQQTSVRLPVPRIERMHGLCPHPRVRPYCAFTVPTRVYARTVPSPCPHTCALLRALNQSHDRIG